MPSKMFSQAVLRGHVDSYCLACETHFKSDVLIDRHILDPAHKCNIESVGYVEKYKDNKIRKVKKGYFCEICNEILNIAAKVGIHLDDHQHVNKKGAMLLKRVGGNIVAFENINIDEKAWNGLIEETCVLCNAEFENAEIHKSETLHKLKLVQCQTQFGSWGILYRKIDEDSFHCLPCNKVFSMIFVGTHFDTEDHKQICLKAISDVTGVPLNKSEPESTGLDVKDIEKSKTNADVAAVPTSNKSKSENTDADVKGNEKTKPTLKSQKELDRPPQPSTISVDIQKPFPVRAVSYEYESLVCNLLNANSYVVQIDKGVIRCILCEKQMTAITLAAHIKDPDHQYLLKAHKKRLDKFDQIKQVQNESKIIESIERFKNNNIDIDLVKGTAECKICYKELAFDCDSIDFHIDDHKSRMIAKQLAIKKEQEANEAAIKFANELDKEEAEKKVKKTSGTTEAERTKPETETKQEQRSRSSSSSSIAEAEKIDWVKEHNITLNQIQKKAYCSTCNSTMPISTKNLKQHVAGNAHKKMLAKGTPVSVTKMGSKRVKVPTKEFIKSFVLVENLMYQYFIINNKYVITYKSMSFMKKTFGGYLKCLLCNDDLIDSPRAIEVHRTIRKHSLASEKAQVIVSLDPEFVREINSGEFHCGYCNDIEKSWGDLQQHFTTVAHNESRTAAEWRLQEFTKK